jgi:hypothetical protein
VMSMQSRVRVSDRWWSVAQNRKTFLRENGDRARDDAVASFSFGVKHSSVGQREQVRRIFSILRKTGETGADRHLNFFIPGGK